ncbi:MAG: hypothetical protein KIT84_13740 [Labilithrix sp.]|nr:hypothetical protein [Labilithrix sp.]MCW5812081.1 hypothetical protein [Labilithrix sp.]
MIRTAFISALLLSLLACGGEPPPKSPSDTNDSSETSESGGGGRRSGGGAGGPSIAQELGSIDQRGVEKMTNALLNGKLESECHRQARGRLEYITGDVKMFFRIDQAGKVKYSYFEDSTLGDRETEKCILDLFAKADWPKPIGGEAEVRNGFGWTPGDERAPAPWTPDKVLMPLEKDKDVKENVGKCKAGVTGDFKVTAYVEPGEVEKPAPEPPPEPKKGAKPDPKKGPKKPAADEPEHGGRFKAIGVSSPNKDAAEKVDCLVDALKMLSLPSPGSYAAKVTFTL